MAAAFDAGLHYALPACRFVNPAGQA
jgi:hypothetical protein